MPADLLLYSYGAEFNFFIVQRLIVTRVVFILSSDPKGGFEPITSHLERSLYQVSYRSGILSVNLLFFKDDNAYLSIYAAFLEIRPVHD